MAAIWTNWGERHLLPHIPSGPWILFSNDITPDIDTVFADLVEADFGGYARVGFAGWSAPFMNPDDHAQAEHPFVVWTHDGGDANDVYGWAYCTLDLDSEIDKLLFIERFPDGPVTLDTAGQQLRLDPVSTLRSMFEP
jgi:hypothetical protein